MPLPASAPRWALPTLLAIAILAVASFATLTYVQSLSGASRWVAHSREVREQLNALSSVVLEAEARHDAWVRNASSSDQQEMLAALSNIDAVLDTLGRLTADNASQLSRLQRIEILARARLSNLPVPVTRPGRVRDAENELAVQMKRLIFDMAAEEERLLDRRLAEFNSASRVSSWSTLALGLLSALLIVGLQYRAWRHSRRLLGLNRALGAKEQALQGALQALRAADRRKDEFLAMLSHELRNPLAPIRNAVGILQRCVSADPVVSQTTTVLERQVLHMVRLVDDLLDVARITRGEIRLQNAKVDVADIVHAALEVSMPSIERFRHELALSLPEEPLPVYGDSLRLSQVLINLLNNAAKYTPPGGRIEVGAQPDGNDVVLSVLDNGPGIAPADLARAFEMFNRLGREDDAARGGLGVGLSLAKTLVELHGGTLEGQGGPEGRGCQFIVRLPSARRVVESLTGKTRRLAA